MELYKNGSIITMEQEKVFTYMLVDQGTIVEIGKGDPPEGYRGASVLVDLKGKTVLPGFFDSHMHLISTFFNETSILFDDARSISDVLQLIEMHQNKYDQPVVLGKRLSQFNLKERRLPTRHELDKVSGNFPLVINSIEFHSVLMNSYAMNFLRIPFLSIDYEKNELNQFTGRIRNSSAAIALKKVYSLLSDDFHLVGADKTFQKAVKKGLTTLVAVEGGPLFHPKHPDLILENKHRFPIDVELFYSTTDLKKIVARELTRAGGDLFLDGSFRSRNAAIFDPYKDAPDNLGNLFFTEGELTEFIKQAHSMDLQISVHAVGPRAIELLVNTYEKVLRGNPKEDHRHRIEHFELPDPSQILKAKSLGLVLAMHPAYEHFFREEDNMYDTRLGKSRALLTNPFRSILDEGIIVAGCSDSDVLPLDPLLGVHAAVNHPNPLSRVSTYEALEMFTINGAYSIFQEKEKGSLKPGKKADFIVLDKNPLMINSGLIKDIKVLQTYKGGHLIYDGGDLHD